MAGFKDLPDDEERSVAPSSPTHIEPIRSRIDEGAGAESIPVVKETPLVSLEAQFVRTVGLSSLQRGRVRLYHREKYAARIQQLQQ